MVESRIYADSKTIWMAHLYSPNVVLRSRFNFYPMMLYSFIVRISYDSIHILTLLKISIYASISSLMCAIVLTISFLVSFTSSHQFLSFCALRFYATIITLKDLCSHEFLIMSSSVHFFSFPFLHLIGDQTSVSFATLLRKEVANVIIFSLKYEKNEKEIVKKKSKESC